MCTSKAKRLEVKGLLGVQLARSCFDLTPAEIYRSWHQARISLALLIPTWSVCIRLTLLSV